MDKAKLLDTTQKTTYHEQDGNIVVNSYQDVEPAMEYAAKARRADREERGAFGKRKELHRTMSVPFNVIQMICVKHSLDFFNPEHSRAILKILKTPEYAAFRTTADRNI